MKHRAILGVTLVFAAAAVAANWQDFTSAKYKFSVKFPGKPKEMNDGKLNIVGFEKDKSTSYTVISGNLGVEVGAGKTDAVLNETRNSFVQGPSGGKLVDEKKIMIGKYPGREINVKTVGDNFMRARMYLVKDLLYQVIAVGSKEAVSSADTTKFMDSFKLAE